MPEYLVMDGKAKPVQLQPFKHQVGGHSSMFQFDAITVCKPLIPRELFFYESMPKELIEFTPQFRGIVEVTFHEDQDGYITLTAVPVESKKKKNKRVLVPSTSPNGEKSDSDSDGPPVHRSRGRQRFRIHRSGSIEVEGIRDCDIQNQRIVEKDALKSVPSPWSIRCHREHLAKMKNAITHNSPTYECILLENLTCRFKWPCILDLKMGTRQHGDDATDEKRETQMRKCANTTSSTLGVRICGMQVYQVNTKHYIYHNKYYGRELTVEGVKDTLKQFLHNGETLRIDLVEPIIARLRQLYEVLRKQHTFRFYSSSLLVMYDGAKTQSPTQYNLPDLSGAHEVQSSSHDNVTSSDTDSLSCSGGGASAAGNIQGASVPRCSSMTASASSDEDFTSTAAVDVRMIDFAHTTYQGFRGDQTSHQGPDGGYLFGLESLVQMFEKIRDEISQD